MTFSVALLQPADWQLYATLRGEAVTEFPQFFGGGAEECERTPEQWRHQLEKPERWYFVGYDNGHPIALTGMKIRAGDPPLTVNLIASYFRPDWRGRGLSHLLYESRFNYARDVLGMKHATINHRMGNIASGKAAQKHGFKQVGLTENARFGDGTTGNLVEYFRDL